MMPGILIGGSDAFGRKVNIAYTDYLRLVTQTGSLADIKLPEKFKPQAYPDGMFGFDFARVNPEPLGLGIDATAIQQVWDDLENEGLPLEEVTQGLIIWDITKSMRGIPSQTPGQIHHYYSSIPSFACVVQLVGHIAEIRAFPQGHCHGFDSRLAELRRNLRGIFRGKALGKVVQEEYFRAVNEAGVSLTAKESEFNVLKQLLRSGHTCKLSKSGADFKVADKNDLRCEIKSRHENIFQYLNSKEQAQGIIGLDPVSILPESFFALVCWATFATIRRAMDEQKSQILFCDLSHTFVGLLLPAIESFWKMNFNFSDAMINGFNLAVSDKQVVLIFVSLPGVTHHMRAAVLERSAIEPFGETAVRQSWCAIGEPKSSFCQNVESSAGRLNSTFSLIKDGYLAGKKRLPRIYP